MTDAELIARLRNAAITIGLCDDGEGRDAVIKAADLLNQQQQVLQWIAEHGDGEARQRARAALAQGQKEGD